MKLIAQEIITFSKMAETVYIVCDVFIIFGFVFVCILSEASAEYQRNHESSAEHFRAGSVGG